VDYQQVYAASAFSGPLTITSVDFYFKNGGSSKVIGVLGGHYNVYLSTTSAVVNALSTNLPTNRGSDWTWVGTVSPGSDTNPMLVITTMPFTYNPTKGNLLFEIIGVGQANLCNGCGGGYDQTDFSGLVISRASSYSTVPETGSWLMMVSGVVGMAGAVRRRLSA
jgi:hypothetical protein